MRRTLGPLLTTLVLTVGPASGCGDSGDSGDSGGTAADSPSSVSSSPADDGAVRSTTIDVIGLPAAGGTVDERGTVLDDDAAVSAFAEQFRNDAAGERIRAAVDKADVPSGQTVVGAVVAIGCDVPRGVTVHAAGDGLAITAMKVRRPMQECLVPVTSVALVSVDSGEL
jgi:hypothetical protein